MEIYGVAILAICFLIGQYIGELLGASLGLSGNLGGVGISMLILILLNDYFKKKDLLKPETEKGILFWSTMYIPVVVAMSASQNVKAALSGGWVVVLAALMATTCCFLLIPVLAKLGQKNKQ